MTHSREEIFAALLQEHTGFIHNSLNAYENNEAQRDELYQEVALALWRALPRFRGDASHRTLIARITHNIGVSHIRKAMSNPSTGPLEGKHLSDLPSPETEAVAQDNMRALLLAVNRLPLGLRQTVSLYLEDFSNREIAEILGLSEGNVAVRLTRARRSLSQLMEKSR